MFCWPLHSFVLPVETIYTAQNGRAALCSIESSRKCFNQGIETLGHCVRLSSSQPAHTRRWHKHNLHTRAEMAVIQVSADDGARRRQTHLRSVFVRNNQRSPKPGQNKLK